MGRILAGTYVHVEVTEDEGVHARKREQQVQPEAEAQRAPIDDLVQGTGEEFADAVHRHF